MVKTKTKRLKGMKIKEYAMEMKEVEKREREREEMSVFRLLFRITNYK